MRTALMERVPCAGVPRPTLDEHGLSAERAPLDGTAVQRGPRTGFGCHLGPGIGTIPGAQQPWRPSFRRRSVCPYSRVPDMSKPGTLLESARCWGLRTRPSVIRSTSSPRPGPGGGTPVRTALQPSHSTLASLKTGQLGFDAIQRATRKARSDAAAARCQSLPVSRPTRL
jgi:hypothetical protein